MSLMVLLFLALLFLALLSLALLSLFTLTSYVPYGPTVPAPYHPN